MTILAKELEAMRGRMVEAHGQETYLLERLRAESERCDGALLAALGEMIEAHKQRRGEIGLALAALAARLGAVDGASRLPAGEPAATRDFVAPLARAIAEPQRQDVLPPDWQAYRHPASHQAVA